MGILDKLNFPMNNVAFGGLTAKPVNPGVSGSPQIGGVKPVEVYNNPNMGSYSFNGLPYEQSPSIMNLDGGTAFYQPLLGHQNGIKEVWG